MVKAKHKSSTDDFEPGRRTRGPDQKFGKCSKGSKNAPLK